MKNDFFESLNEAIRNTESSVVNFVSAIAPWLAPLSPAYMTFQHAIETLNFPIYIALPVAVVVEILGFSAVSTFLAFYFYNRRNSAQSKKAPVNVVVVSFVFYLALIVSSNVLLDAFPKQAWAINTVRALLALQTIPAALIVAVRTQHRDLLSELAREKAKKDSETSGNFPPASETSEELSTDNMKVPQWRTFKKNVSNDDLLLITNMTPKTIADKYKMTTKAAKDWPEYARRELVSRGVLQEH